VVEDPAPNAFATGRDPEHSVVCVTTGLLPLLTKVELEGVIAHELSHIGNRDMLLGTVAVVLVGFVSIICDIFRRASFYGGNSDRDNKAGTALFILGIIASILAPLAATMIQLAISRKREFLADASGVLLTRYPDGLATALQKIGKYGQPMQKHSSATAHLFISNPLGRTGEDEDDKAEVSWFAKLFSTHPPIKERIAALVDSR
jgi:heat shock protein HtpX